MLIEAASFGYLAAHDSAESPDHVEDRFKTLNHRIERRLMPVLVIGSGTGGLGQKLHMLLHAIKLEVVKLDRICRTSLLRCSMHDKKITVLRISLIVATS